MTARQAANCATMLLVCWLVVYLRPMFRVDAPVVAAGGPMLPSS